MHLVRGPELPDPEGDAGCRAARAEEVLPARAEAHAAQGVAEEVTRIRGRRSGRRATVRRRRVRGRIAGAGPTPGARYERSSIGRAPVSKTGGWGFDSLRSCSRPPDRVPSRRRTVRGDRARDATSALDRAHPAAAQARSHRDRCHGQSQRWIAGAKSAKVRLKGRAGREGDPKASASSRSWQPGPDRPVQADAGQARPALDGARPGADRRPGALAALRDA